MKKYYHLWKKVRFQSLFPLLLQVEARSIRRVSVPHSHVDARGCCALHNSKGAVLSTVLTFEENFSVLQKLAGGGGQPTAMESQHCVRAEQASRMSLLLSLKPWRRNILVHTRKQNTPALQSESKCMQVRPIHSEHSLFQAAGVGRGDWREGDQTALKTMCAPRTFLVRNSCLAFALFLFDCLNHSCIFKLLFPFPTFKSIFFSSQAPGFCLSVLIKCPMSPLSM